MRPVLFVLSSVDFGRALVIDLFVFLLLLGWRRVARALGENVPPLTPLGALESMCLATAVTAALWWVSNRFGPIEVKSYGAMLVAGFVAATAWCMKEGGRQGYKPV
ncbi:MAG: hypothetical protein H5T86_16330, partial [Armatimonadetes bacterium]|nr:hypothetical protein [Armatimonadota bacterium]